MARRQKRSLKPRRPWRERAWRTYRSWRWPWQLFLVLVPAAISASVSVWAVLHETRTSQSAPATCAPNPSRRENQLTATNDARHGVWTFTSPRAFPGFSNDDERPPAGERWLPNCTVVDVRCVRDGGSYTFNNLVEGSPVQLTWRTWAQLEDGDWLPLAEVLETTGLREPSLGLPRCA